MWKVNITFNCGQLSANNVFGFSEHQEKSTEELGYKLTLTGNINNDVMNKAAAPAVVDAKIVISGIDWYVPHYAPSIEQQAILSKQIFSKTRTEIHYVEKIVFMEEVNTQNLWIFELGSQEGIKVPIWIIVGFLQKDWLISAVENNDTCHKPLV